MKPDTLRAFMRGYVIGILVFLILHEWSCR